MVHILARGCFPRLVPLTTPKSNPHAGKWIMPGCKVSGSLFTISCSTPDLKIEVVDRMIERANKKAGAVHAGLSLPL